MKMKLLFIFTIVCASFAGEEVSRVSPIKDRTLGKQFSDAQHVLQTVPAEFIKNDGEKKAIEAKMAKECEAAKKLFLLDPQSGEPGCTDKPPVPAVPAKTTSEPEAKK